jgi:hypothetical protein
MSTARRLLLDEITADIQAQPRKSILTDTVSEYAERMAAGDEFPMIVVFYDGATYWLADGFHRYHAAKQAGLRLFECAVCQGGLRDAVLFSCGANAAHGVPRTNEDKRRAVMKLLQDAEWSHQMSLREMGRHCAVSESYVRKLHDELSAHNAQMQKPTERTVTRAGTTYVQNTANIGKRAAAPPASKPPAAREPTEQQRAITSPAPVVAPALQPAAVDHGEIAGLANALYVGLAGLDPILDRIAQLGVDAFWRHSGDGVRVLQQVESSLEFLRPLAALAPSKATALAS